MMDDFLKKAIRIPEVRLPPIGKCIYCGCIEGLSDEHIVPYSFNGNFVLDESSCKECSEITSKFELRVARMLYGAIRQKYSYQSRSRKKKKVRVPYQFSYQSEDGTTKSVVPEFDEYPYVASVPYLPPPGIYKQLPLSDSNPEFTLMSVVDPDALRKLTERTGEKTLTVRHTDVFSYSDFCRLLAKIAHGYLVTLAGEHNGYIPLLPDLILEKSYTYSHYIGGVGANVPVTMLVSHVSTGFESINGKVYVVCDIHLLSGVPAPMYRVIAAEVTDNSVLVQMAATAKMGTIR